MRAVRMSPVTLSFSDVALESEFRAEYARSAIRSARATTILIIVLYAGYLWLDLRAGTLGQVWPLRLAVIAHAHFDTVRLPFPPAWIQRVGLVLGMPFGRLLGYRATYERKLIGKAVPA